MSNLTIYSPLKLGSIIANRYLLHESLGEGGAAYVYLAEDYQEDRRVAIKHLNLPENMPKDLKDNQLQRFKNEAQLMTLLDHPHIMSVYEYLEFNGHHYMVMEYLQGSSLGVFIKKHHNPRETLEILEQVAGALDYAHSKNIVHRDIKPDNIMIIKHHNQYHAKLLDFGIARLEYSQRLTSDGTILGTVAYMSPEQLQNSRNTTHQSDVYSFGMLMYELFTGQLPFLVDNPGTAIVQIFSQEPVPPVQIKPELGPDLSQIIMTCIDKFPQHRFASCLLLQQHLRGLINKVFHQDPISQQAVLPRIRKFQEFRLLELLNTLIERKTSGQCLVWNSFQESRIYLDAGQIKAIKTRNRILPAKEALKDTICWESGNFCFIPKNITIDADFLEDQHSLLSDLQTYLEAFQVLWHDYQDHDIPEVIMKPTDNDNTPQECREIISSIEGEFTLGQIYTLLPYDRLSVLEHLKNAEDRQFLFFDRVRH